MYYSSCHEDKLIRERFYPDYEYKGVMVEVGAGPPTYISNSKHFRENGWRTICVDPNPKFVKQHKEEGSEIYQYACSNTEGSSEFTINYNNDESYTPESDGVSFSALDIRHKNLPSHNKQETITVETIRLDTLLARIGVDKVDFLSIDVEGWEMEVLSGFGIQKYQPDVIMLENLTNDPAYKYYMMQCGYKLHTSIGGNQIYISPKFQMKRTIEDTKRDVINLYSRNDARYGVWGWCSLDKAGCIVDSINDICERVDNPVAVEIGVYGGKSIFPAAMEFKRHGKGVIHAIDPWSNEEAIKGYDGVNAEYWSNIPLNSIYDIFIRTIEETETAKYIDVVRNTSDGAPDYGEIDFLYIDGQHTEQALKDAEKYASKVKVNGYCYCDDVGWGKVKALPYLMGELGFQRINVVEDCYMYKRVALTSTLKHHQYDWVDESKYTFKNYPYSFDWGNFTTEGVYTIQREVINEKVYRFFRDIKPGDRVLDLGCSVGAWMISVVDQEPATAILVDGSTSFIELAKTNLKQSLRENNVGVNYYTNIIIDPDSPSAQSLMDADKITFKEFREKNNLGRIDFMKMDIEGGEYSVLADENIDWILGNVEFISMELHLRDANNSDSTYNRDRFIEFRDKHLRKFKNYKVFSDHCFGPQQDLSRKIWDNDFVMNYQREMMMYIDNGDNIDDEPIKGSVKLGTIAKKQQKSVWIVDNFYEDPDSIREFALKQSYHQGGIGKGYIGNRTWQQFLFPGLKESFENIMGKKITGWEGYDMNGRFQWGLAGAPQVWHCDSQMWGGMLYLTPDPPFAYGTTMYANKKTRARTYRDKGWDASWYEPGDCHLDGQDFEPVDVLGNVYNRLVIFDAACIHSASGYFGGVKDNCRLWQMFFFDTEKED